MEIWDGYRKDGEPAGCCLRRNEPIPPGIFHLVSEIFVRHTDGSVLLMQRDWNKPNFPGLFEVGASGSVLKGETPLQGALRELREETGLVAGELSLIYQQSNLRDTFYFGFLCRTDCPKDAVLLQEGETIGFRWMEWEPFLDFIKTPAFVGPQRDRWLPFLKVVGSLPR